jgi:hypothetical protein
LSLRLACCSLGAFRRIRGRKHLGGVLILGLELLEYLSVFDFVVRLPGIFGIRIAFPGIR